jgi:hypothetical protein
MSWADFLENPEYLASFFDNNEGLEKLSLFEASLDRDGPTLRLRANLNRFPDRPSARWHPSFNQAQVTLALSLFDEIEVHGWRAVMDGQLVVSRVSRTELTFSFESRGVAIRGRAHYVRLDNLTAHQRIADSER